MRKTLTTLQCIVLVLSLCPALVYGQLSAVGYEQVFTLNGSLNQQLALGGIYAPGDLSGDGIGDMVVVSGADNTNINPDGTVTVYSGADFSVLFNRNGATNNDHFGLGGLLFPGDLDNDGIQDMLVSIPGLALSASRRNVGAVQALSAGNSYSQLYQITGTFDFDGLTSIHLLQDLNNDGAREFLMNAPNADSTNSIVNNGISKVISSIGGTELFRVVGGAGESRTFVTTMPDINGDGFDELVFRGGGLNIYSGLTGSRITGHVNAGDSQWPQELYFPGDFTGDGRGDILGWRGSTLIGVNATTGAEVFTITATLRNGQGALIAMPGDLNNDNRADFIVGDPIDTSRTGLVRAISGSDGAELWRVTGALTNTELGRNLQAVGDLNDDGVTDVILAAAREDGVGGSLTDAGAVLALSGATGTELFRKSGRRANERLGQRFFGPLDDVDGDTVTDIVIVSPQAYSLDGLSERVGVISVISGATGTEIYEIEGDQPGTELGGYDELPLTGDLTGDGIEDFIALIPASVFCEGGCAGSVAVGDEKGGEEVEASMVDIDPRALFVSGVDGTIFADLIGAHSRNTTEEFGHPGYQVLSDFNGDGAPEFVRSDHSGQNFFTGSLAVYQSFEADQCPEDPLKLAPGECGCGTSDDDSDSDLVLDCFDSCPNDPAKSASVGICGCGIDDGDGDGDGMPSCLDACPNDARKSESEGQCGCGVLDLDSDGDGTATCIDACPADPQKSADAGGCGCGVADLDLDGNSILDCDIARELAYVVRITRESLEELRGLKLTASSRQRLRVIRRTIAAQRAVLSLHKELFGRERFSLTARLTRTMRLMVRARFLSPRRRRRSKRVMRRIDSSLTELREELLAL